MPDEKKLYLPVKPVDLEFLGAMEVLDANIYPLPGGSEKRTWTPDERLKIVDPKSTDVLTYYEHRASVRHKPTGRIFVAFQETMDGLYARQKDPTKYPTWLMNESVKQADRRIHIYQAKANPRKIAESRGLGVWFEQWLTPVDDDVLHEALVFYLMSQKLVSPEMYKAA